MAYLYVNNNGQPVSSLSYSAGATFDKCPKLFSITKREGYAEKDLSAAMRFGIAVEAGVQYFHERGEMKRGMGEAEFRRRWHDYQFEKDLDFGKDGSWIDMNRMGSDMLALYESRVSSLPIRDPRFQINYKKNVFQSSSEYDGIRHNSYIDMVSTLQEDHPMLPPGTRQVVIDIKTAGMAYPSIPGICRLDPQLREYAWATGISAVGFLVFVKSNPMLRSGDPVTVLLDSGQFTAGSIAIVLNQDEEAGTLTIVSQARFDEFKSEEKQISGRGSKAKKQELFDGLEATTVTHDTVTKQRIQFLTGTMTPEDLLGVGQRIGRQIVEIKACEDAGHYPQKPGIRFPTNHCLGCKGLGVCLGDDKLTQERLVERIDW